MEGGSGGGSKNIDEETCPKLLDLISKGREWFRKRDDDLEFSSNYESKLELKLGPPGQEEVHEHDYKKQQYESLLSLGCFSNGGNQTKTTHNNHKHKFSHLEKPHVVNWFMQQQQQQLQGTRGPQRSAAAAVIKAPKESSQNCCNSNVAVVDMQQQQQQTAPANTAVPNSSQKRTAPGPVVGWPPIRSFRKNLAASSSSAKPTIDVQNVKELNPNKKVATEKPGLDTGKKGLFVKINMDGVPIGRKVDLKAYDSYGKLSVAVDELFRGLLAAQRDSSADGNMNSKDEEEGILNGSGEYTLVYEDNEGDRMLVGDVPWHMFVSTVKRLRVLKSSEVSLLSLGASKQEKIAPLQ